MFCLWHTPKTHHQNKVMYCESKNMEICLIGREESNRMVESEVWGLPNPSNWHQKLIWFMYKILISEETLQLLTEVLDRWQSVWEDYATRNSFFPLPNVPKDLGCSFNLNQSRFYGGIWSHQYQILSKTWFKMMPPAIVFTQQYATMADTTCWILLPTLRPICSISAT